MTERLSDAAILLATNVRLARSSYQKRLLSTRQAGLSSVGSQTARTFVSTSSAFFGTSTSAQAGGYQRELGRQKRHERDALRYKRAERRREKDHDGSSRLASAKDKPRSPEREELEAQIQAYMAATGPKGERLNLREKEKLLKVELGTLGKELDNVEKKVKSDEDTAHLPPLDDQTLEEIYQALMLPPPPTEEETRLARLASGRREQKLLESVRGRRELEKLPLTSLPPNLAERSRLKVSRSLRQKLIDATVRSRMLLPPTTQPRSTTFSPNEEESEVPSDVEDYIDLAGLPPEERQEIRLQQLFARLAVVQSNSGSSNSLHDLRSSLAQRIAKILQSHQYHLPTPPSDQGLPEAPDAKPVDEKTYPEFEPLRLDMANSVVDGATETSISLTEPDTTEPDTALPAEASRQAELLVKVESMLQNLTSSESRKFMLDGIERLLPTRDHSVNDSGENAESQSATAETFSTSSPLPLGVVSLEEWTALSVSSAKANDWESLTRTLSLMERAGYFPPPLVLYNNLLDVFAKKGDVASCLQVVSFLTATSHTADDYTYHSLTKVYVETAQFAKAIELLNSLEEQSKPAAMATYTMLISKLMNYAGVGSAEREDRPELQSLAWSVFHHMRLAAHPVPDAPLYALMIRACAKGIPQPQDIDDPSKTYTSLAHNTSSQSGSGFVASGTRVSEAERALDLFREMTTRYNVRPNSEVYNSLILACARRKDFYLEAFRLLREMVGLENERVDLPSGASASVLRFAPDRYTFNALLQGCAKNRDLPRARWVLAEMIRTTLPLFDDAIRPQLSRAQKVEMLSKRPNEETLCHLFHTYASFEPTIRRQEMRLQDSTEASQSEKATEEAETPAATEATRATSTAKSAASDQRSEVVAQSRAGGHTTAEEAAHVFSALVPQTSADVIAEARSLFARVLADQPHNSIEGPLGAVKPSIRLVNAYIAVLSAHLEDEVKGRIMGSILFGDSRTGLLEKAALVLQSDNKGVHEHDRPLEESLIARLGLAANEHTFNILLQTYSMITTTNKQALQDLARQVHIIWTKFNEYAYCASADQGTMHQRQIKHCWTSYIHFWAKHAELQPTSDRLDSSIAGQGEERSALPGLDTAMTALKKFARLYPPRPPVLPRQTAPQTKSSLFGPLDSEPKWGKKDDKMFRMLSNLDLSPLGVPQKSLESLRALAEQHDSGLRRSSDTPTTDVSSAQRTSHENAQTYKQPDEQQFAPSLPTLTFVDVELLHHRLVRYSRVKDLAYLTWFLRRSSAASRPRKLQL